MYIIVHYLLTKRVEKLPERFKMKKGNRKMKFQLKKTFYTQPTYEFNLPAGHSCPFAKDCKIKVDKDTGKFEIIGKKFRYYAASSERFPGVRKSRWENFEAVKRGDEIVIPKDATHIRIHSSGDFYSQEYFDRWLDVCRKNPQVKFWAFTKSIGYWINRINDIPSNLTLQASKGSLQDDLIDKYHLKYAEVFSDIKDVPKDMTIDTNDAHAMSGTESFALLDNNKYSKKDNYENKR